MKIHMVKKGDTLYEIAKKYNVDLDKLIASNPQITDPNVIEVGMKVKIPNAPMPVIPPTDYLHKHVVVQGDTLWKLGKSWNVPLQMLITANPQLKNPNILMTGEVVYIPKVKPHHESHQHENDHPHQPENAAQHHHHHTHPTHHNKPNTAPIPVPMPAPAPEVEQPIAVIPPNKPIQMPEPLPKIEFQMQLKPVAPLPEYLQPESYTPPMKPMQPMQQEQPQYLQPESYTPPMKPMQPMQQEQPQYLQPESYTPPMKPMQPMQQEQPQYLQPESYTPPMQPMQPLQSNQSMQPMMPMMESMNAYPWYDNQPNYVQGVQAQMWGHSPHDMNLFQQYQEPAAEVFTQDYMNAPHQSMWSEPMLSPLAGAPNWTAMPTEASYGGMPNYPFYQQPQQGVGDCGCGCGGPVMHTQAMPYPYTMPISQMPNAQMPNAQMPNAQMPNAQMPNAQMPNAPMPYGTWPTAQSPVSYGEMPVYSQGFEPMAVNSAYPASMYPMSMHPNHMVHPYGWSPYGAGMQDCGCNSKYELEQLLRQQSEAEARAKAEISTKTGASEEKKLTVQNTSNNRKKASISTKAAKPAQRNGRSAQKTSKASTNSPWLIR